MGGGGTGKTWVLELVGFTAGMEPDRSEFSPRFAEVVASALGDVGAASLTVQTRLGQRLTIRRTGAGAHEVINADTGLPADLDWPPFDEDDLDIFSQNELELVSVDADARRALLDRLCGQDIARIRAEISDIAGRLDVNATRIVQVKNEIEALRSQADQLPKLRLELDVAEKTYQELLASVTAQQADKATLDKLARRRQVLGIEEDLLAGLLGEAEAAISMPFPWQTLARRLTAALSEESLANLDSKELIRSLR